MGFFDKKASQLATKLIAEYTGQIVYPEICVPAHASITSDWNGYCVLTGDALFLVNKYGARGVTFSNLEKSVPWGQYPVGTRGYPKYSFAFRFVGMPEGFTIYPKTTSGGMDIQNFLANKFIY